MTDQQRDEFEDFCRQLSDREIEGIIEKETESPSGPGFRAGCLEIALNEAESRELDV